MTTGHTVQVTALSPSLPPEALPITKSVLSIVSLMMDKTWLY